MISVLTIFFLYFFAKEKKIYIFLYLYHLIFIVIFYNFIILSGGDFLVYVNHSKAIFGIGVESLLGFIFVLKKFMPVYEINLLFNLFSFIAIILFYEILKKLGLSNLLALSLCLLPSMHFFTSSIGKDGLIILALMMIVYYTINTNSIFDKKNLLFILLSLLIILLIRPHIFLIVTTLYCVSILIFLSKKKLLFFIALNFILLFIFLLQNISDILCIFIQPFCNETNIIEILSQIRQFGEVLEGGEGTDYKRGNIIYNAYAYLFFPVEFINSRSILISLAVTEGIALFYIIFLIIKKNLNNYDIKVNKSSLVFVLFFTYFFTIIYLAVFSNVYSNFGLVLRQKIMVIPYLVFFCLSVKNLFLLSQEK
jgi:hypothetical protein